MTANFGIGWRQVGSAFLLLAAISFIASGYSVVAVPLGQEFHPSRMVLMLAMTVLSGVSALLAPFLGNLMDRVSLRALMTLGALMLAAGYAALSFAADFNQVLIIFGLLIAPANVLMGPVATTVLLSRWFVKRRGTAIGIAVAGVAMGSVVYPPIVQFLIDHYPWREAFRLLALVLLVGALPAALLVVNRPADRGLHADGAATDPLLGQAERGEAGKISARAILTDPSFWLAAAIVAIVTSGMKGMITNLAPVVMDQGFKARDAAWLISLYGGCGFVAKLAFAAVADRLGLRPLLFVSLIGFAAGMAFLTQAAAGFPAILTGVALIGLFGGIMVPMQSLLVPKIFGERVVGRAMGLMSMVMLCALLASPPLFGRIFDVSGSYMAIFLTFTVLAALAMLMVPYLRLHPRSEAPAAAVPSAV
jgi:predicted MFS family arabinose efflux permease